MTGRRIEIAAAGAVVGVVVVAGLLLNAWRGFPKGVDAYQHLTRLNFVADWFPHHNWFYAWAAGMPMFDNYPGLPYVAALPFVRLFGDTTTLELMALAAMVAFGLGLYGHVRVRTGRPDIALLVAVMVVTSMAIWHFVLASGVYARVVAMGFGGLAWWAHAMALSRHSGRWWALTAVLIAATIACHPVTGAFVAGYVTLAQLSSRSPSGSAARSSASTVRSWVTRARSSSSLRSSRDSPPSASPCSSSSCNCRGASGDLWAPDSRFSWWSRTCSRRTFTCRPATTT